MGLESNDTCPECGSRIVLRRCESGAFRCPDCRCEFRHNPKKWLLGIPAGLVVALVLFYVTRSYVPPLVIGVVAAVMVAGAISRIPSYIVTSAASSAENVTDKK